MKKALASILIILLSAVLILLIGAGFVASSSAVAHAADAQTETPTSVSVIKAPVSNLKDNEFAGISTLKIIVNDVDEFYIPESYFVIFKMNVPNSEMKMVQYSYDYSKTPRLRDFFVASGEPSDILVSGGADDESELRKLFPDVTLHLKDDVSEATVGNRLITSAYTLKLLGFNADGSQVYVDAVLGGDVTSGFIAKDSLKAFNVPYQERSQAERDALLAEQNKPHPEKGDLVPPNTSVALRIVLIIGIAIPALLIVFFLFKPTKGEQAYAKKTVRRSRKKDEYDYDNPRSYRDRRRSRDDDDRNSRDDDYERSRRSRDDDYDRDRRSSRDDDYDRDSRSSRGDRDRYDDRNSRDRRDRYDDRDDRRDYDDRR